MTDPAAWREALTDALLPAEVNAGRPVRLACDDDAVAAAARTLGLPRDRADCQLVDCLRAHGLIDPARGVSALAKLPAPDCLPGLALLVLAASRMDTDDRASMHAYYQRLADLLAIPRQDEWPHIPGTPQLADRFADLKSWLAVDQAGQRGLLDLPPVDPSRRVVGVPIGQTMLRAGDRRPLSAFFERAGRLIDLGWDPVHQLRRWGGRHQLSQPAQALLHRPELHQPLAAALRNARRHWDGTVTDQHGRAVLPARLTLHPLPGRIALGVTVPTLTEALTVAGPDGARVELTADRPAELPLDWLNHAVDGPVTAEAADGIGVRVLSGATILFEIGPLGLTETPSAVGDDPVWALTCDIRLTAAADDAQRYAADLPDGWQLLCDLDPRRLPEALRDPVPADTDPGALLAADGGLPLAPGVWLLDHPPVLRADLPEPAPVTIDDQARGDLEPDEPLPLDDIAHAPGVHRIYVGDLHADVEMAERGPRDGIGSLAVSLHPRRAHRGPAPVDPDDPVTVSGALVAGADTAGWRPPLIVRYRADIDVIDRDGTVRSLAPPAPAAWRAHVGLPEGDSWEINSPQNIAWVCVHAPGREQVIAVSAVDVPLTDAVLDIAEDFEHVQTVVDRTDGRARQRWQRLLDALEVAA